MPQRLQLVAVVAPPLLFFGLSACLHDGIWVCSDIGAWEPPRMPALVQKIAYVGKNNNSGKLQP